MHLTHRMTHTEKRSTNRLHRCGTFLVNLNTNGIFMENHAA